MTARHLMQIAALMLALGLTGAAIAQNTEGTTGTQYMGYGMDTPSSGAIVTPEDKAMGLGRGDERARNRDSDVNDDTSMSNGNVSNDRDSAFNPWPTKDDLSSVNPRPSSDEGMSVEPGRADVEHAPPSDRRPISPGVMNRESTLDEDESAPARTGSNVQPGDMGPGNVRGQ